MSTTQLGLSTMTEAQALAYLLINDSLVKIDAIIQLSVKDRGLTSPPGSPVEGDRYLIAATATGTWTGHDGQIAIYTGGGWVYLTAKEGWKVWIDDEDLLVIYDGSSWVVHGRQATTIAALAQTISGSYSQAEVQAISTKVDAVIAALKTAKLMAT